MTLRSRSRSAPSFSRSLWMLPVNDNGPHRLHLPVFNGDGFKAEVSMIIGALETLSFSFRRAMLKKRSAICEELVLRGTPRMISMPATAFRIHRHRPAKITSDIHFLLLALTQCPRFGGC